MELSVINKQTKIEYEETLIGTLEELMSACLNHEDVTTDLEVSLMFVDNQGIKELNRDYRGKDQETDVLSFPQYDDFEDFVEEMMLGDIVISLEKAVEQANDYNHSFGREVCYLVVHSMFHLLGYDHMNDDDKQEMRAKEDAVLNAFKILR